MSAWHRTRRPNFIHESTSSLISKWHMELLCIVKICQTFGMLICTWPDKNVMKEDGPHTLLKPYGTSKSLVTGLTRSPVVIDPDNMNCLCCLITLKSSNGIRNDKLWKLSMLDFPNGSCYRHSNSTSNEFSAGSAYTSIKSRKGCQPFVSPFDDHSDPTICPEQPHNVML